jgi:redox-sensitive bicupin YhaK (pirin superfamily)
MSWQPAAEPRADETPETALEMDIEPRLRDLGDGFSVRRVLPFAKRRAVGPFVFFDHFGPTVFAPGQGMDVRPHPHIGLATISYLFEGEILHRDSLGNAQPIRPGEVNWMTAGRGIAHSERTPPDLRPRGSRLGGIQSWVALPRAFEETAPRFAHYEKDAQPTIEGEGKSLRLLAGSLFGKRAPVEVFSGMFYADAEMQSGAALDLGMEHAERAVYIVAGSVEFSGARHEAGRMLVFRTGAPVVLTAREAARLMLLGGESLDGPRHIWWNYVSSSKERIEQAKADWKAGRFAKVPGDDEFIPLPE